MASPLELFFDLVFVVAIASAGAELHHALAEGHYGATVGFLMTFVAIWWAWMNYTWFASAYDNGDVVFRTLSFVVMAGALLLAAGVPDLFTDGQSVIVVIGYAIMRVAMMALWVRAAAGHPDRRVTALTYAVGIGVAQVFWIARLAVGDPLWLVPTFLFCVALELSVPIIAERQGRTPFHPHHIAERFSLLTLIVLGEVILAVVQAVQGAMKSPGGIGDSGVSGELLTLVIGGLLIVFSLWWIYFKRDKADIVAGGRGVWLFSYGHYVVFASVAALGASLAAAVDVVQHTAHVSARPIGLAIAVCLLLFTIALSGIHAVAGGDGLRSMVLPLALSVLVLGIAAVGLSMGLTVLVIGLALTAVVVGNIAAGNRTLVG